MRVNGYVLAFVAVFLFATDIVYFFWSHDPTGTTALAFSVGLAFLVSYYLLFTSRRIEQQPEDIRDADIPDGAGEVGFFSPHSQWPIFLAGGTAIIALGIVFGWWLVFIGAGVLVPALIGLLFQYYLEQPPRVPAGPHEAGDQHHH